MQHDEVTPEYLKRAVEKYLNEFESIALLATAHFKSQIEQTVQLQKELDDRFIQAGIPNFDDQNGTTMKIIEALNNSWQLTLSRCKEKIGVELMYLRSRCVGEIGEEENNPVTTFLNRANNFQEESLNAATIYLLDQIKDSLRYRDNERNEILESFEEHMSVFSGWQAELEEKFNDETATLSESDRKWISKTTEAFENILENHKIECNSYIERMHSVFKGAIDAFQTNCKELIDLSVKSATPDTSKYIDEFKSAYNSIINSFDNCAKLYLERLNHRLAVTRSFFPQPIFDSDYICVKEFKDNLEASLDTIRSELANNMDEILTYREEECREVDREFRAFSLAGEDAKIQADAKLQKKYPNIDISEFPKVSIGSGGEGSVYKCEMPGSLLNACEEKVAVACKKFEHGVVDIGSNEVAALFDLSSNNILRHQNVVRMLGRGFIGDHRYLLIELCPRSLADVISACRENGEFIEKTHFVKWGAKLAGGMNFIHDNGFCHGDLKPNNILIGAFNDVKITDFGISVRNEKAIKNQAKLTFTRGTTRYMAPEQHNARPMTMIEFRRCDVWSYGICLWEMITCRNPFGNIPEEAIPRRIGTNDEISHPPLPKSWNCETLGTILLHCWDPILERRWPFYFIVKQFEDVKEEIEDFCEHAWNEECKNWASAKYEVSITTATSKRIALDRRRSF